MVATSWLDLALKYHVFAESPPPNHFDIFFLLRCDDDHVDIGYDSL
jgi:hypothetical protein